jgi:hypothetical protein
MTSPQKKNMSPHRGESNEQVFMNGIFSEGYLRAGDSVRTTFFENLKIAGKTHFLKF